MAPVLELEMPGAYSRSISLSLMTLDTESVLFPCLTELELHTVRLAPSQYDYIHQILYATPNLRSLIINWSGYFDSESDIAPISSAPELESRRLLRHDHLEVLRLCKLGPKKPNSTLQLPKLQTLDLESLSETSTVRILNYLLRTAPEAPPAIRKMRLSYIHFADFCALVRMTLETFTQTLESLEVASCPTDLNNYILNMLSGPFGDMEGSIICPRLQDLTIRRAGNLNWDSLIHVIKARLPSSNINNPNLPTPIRNLVIDECAVITDEALSWIQANVAGTLSYTKEKVR